MNSKKSLINDDECVTVYNIGNYKEVVCCKHNIKDFAVTRISKNQYVDNKSGEIKEYHYSQNKTLTGIKKQFKSIPRIIKGYFDGDNTERFITLTYSCIITNPYSLSYDFKKFMSKIQRRYGKCRYIYVKEPNSKGSWHIHSLIKQLNGLPFDITEDSLRVLWKNGYAVSTKMPYNIYTLAQYFDVSRYDDKKSRILYYPPGLNIYSYSRDIKIQRTRGLYNEFELSDMTKIYDTENQYIMSDQEDGDVKSHWNTVYEQYLKEV